MKPHHKKNAMFIDDLKSTYTEPGHVLKLYFQALRMFHEVTTEFHHIIAICLC